MRVQGPHFENHFHRGSEGTEVEKIERELFPDKPHQSNLGVPGPRAPLTTLFPSDPHFPSHCHFRTLLFRGLASLWPH